MSCLWKNAEALFVQALQYPFERREVRDIKTNKEDVLCVRRTSVTNLVVYARLDKGTHEPVVRVEWRLRGTNAICRHFDIHDFDSLYRFDSRAFLDHNLRFESINLDEFGKWLHPDCPRSADRAMQWLTDMGKDDRHIPFAPYVWECSAQLRGYLRREKIRINEHKKVAYPCPASCLWR